MAVLRAVLAFGAVVVAAGMQSLKPHKEHADAPFAHRSEHGTHDVVELAASDRARPLQAEVSPQETDALSLFQTLHMVVPNVSSPPVGRRGAWIRDSGIVALLGEKVQRLLAPPNATDQEEEDIADGDHIFGRRENEVVANQDSVLFAVPKSEYAVLGATLLVLMLFEILVLQTFQDGSLRHSMRMMGFWILVAAGYNVYFGVTYGAREGWDWTTGYLLEWLLSMDNLFVFHLIFKAHKTPAKLMDKALFWGIAGAVAFRLLFFLCIGELIHLVHWFRYVFGGVLVYSGIATAVEDEDEEDSDAEADCSGYLSTRILQTVLGPRILEKYDAAGHFLVEEKGLLCATLLLQVVLCLEVTDVVFAVDSVTAKVAQIPNQYVAYSSSVFAMFGLRYMFFVIKELVDMFELLKYGICIILCFIGMQLVLADYLHISSATVFLFIASVFFVCIVGSPRFRGVMFGQQEDGQKKSTDAAKLQEDVVEKTDGSVSKK